MRPCWLFVLCLMCPLVAASCSSNTELDDTLNGNSSQSTITTPTGDINNHNYVDLGLNTLWADRNMGAGKACDVGVQYEIILNKISDAEYQGFSGTSQDPVTQEWGKPWCSPSISDVLELNEKCTFMSTEIDGTEGVKVTGPNGNSIFIPDNIIWLADLASCYYLEEVTGMDYPDLSWIRQTYAKYEDYNNKFILRYCTVITPFPLRPIARYSDSGGDTGDGNISSPYKPDVWLMDYTAYTDKIKVIFRFDSDEKITSAKVYYGTSSPSKSVNATVSGTSMTATVTGLKSGTKYVFQASATNSAGTGYSDITTLMTLY